MRHQWPGNVREREAVLEETMIFQEGGWLKREDLNLPPGRVTRATESRISAATPPPSSSERLREALRRQTAVRLAASWGLREVGLLSGLCLPVSLRHSDAPPDAPPFRAGPPPLLLILRSGCRAKASAALSSCPTAGPSESSLTEIFGAGSSGKDAIRGRHLRAR